MIVYLHGSESKTDGHCAHLSSSSQSAADLSTRVEPSTRLFELLQFRLDFEPE